MSGRVVMGASLALLVAVSPPAWAGCDPPSGVSTCFDADNVWITAGQGRFLTIAPAAELPESKLAFAAAGTFIDRPILLNVPSPDPEGRDIPVVRDAVNLHLSWAFAPRSGFEVTLSTPMTLYQSGSGAEGLTSQSAPPLERTAVHDARVGVGVVLPVPEAAARAAGLAAKARFELALPTGDESAYAGAGGPVAAPSLALGMRTGSLFGGAEVGARLRSSVPFASARVGSALLTAVGF